MKRNSQVISGNIVDILNAEIFPGTLKVSNGVITDIARDNDKYEKYIIPGFIDSHVHIESSMLTPSEFARVAVVHGTVATVSDPHEIANVLGISGVKSMVENAKSVPLKIYFGAPSCVPASAFETSGAVVGPEQVEELLRCNEIKYLGEVMNFPGVLNDDPVLTRKINIAKKYSKLIDGHAPGLHGRDLEKYVNAGISTDHECSTEEEALEKIKLGVKVQIREGSAAKNFDELLPILERHWESCMFCSDDKHPDDLVRGHINDLVKRALIHGIDLMKVLRVACVNPVFHYKLDVGLLRKGDQADFLVIDNLNDLNVLATYINGEIVAREGRTTVPSRTAKIGNRFETNRKDPSDFVVLDKNAKINVIRAIDGQLITDRLVLTPKVIDGHIISDVGADVLKIAVVNRYQDANVAVAFVKGFGLKRGGIASSVAHDSHNIIVVGVTDEDMCRAVNLIIENRGGISLASEDIETILPLTAAGIMSNEDYPEVANKYAEMDKAAKSLGSELAAPFLTLSFMALLVIPKIKLSDKGLFDGERFELIPVFEGLSVSQSR